jgi:hypothetical protein
MLINAKKNMDEKAQGYIISDERGMQMHYEPKPRFNTVVKLSVEAWALQ